MESSRQVNTKMERISGISTLGEWGQKRPNAEQLGERSPRTWAVLQPSPAFLGRHEQEFALVSPAQARLVGERSPSCSWC